MPALPSLTNLPLPVQVVLAVGIAALLAAFGVAAIIRAAAKYKAAGQSSASSAAAGEPAGRPECRRRVKSDPVASLALPRGSFSADVDTEPIATLPAGKIRRATAWMGARIRTFLGSR